MKQLAIFDDYSQAKNICDLLSTHNIPAGVFLEISLTGEMELVYSGRPLKSPKPTSREQINPFSDESRYSVYIAVESQFDDAVALMKNPDHTSLRQLNNEELSEANDKVDSYPDSRILPFLLYCGAALFLLILGLIPLSYLYADNNQPAFALGCAFSVGIMLQSFIMLSRTTTLRNSLTILGFIALASFVLALLLAARLSRNDNGPEWIIYYTYYSYIAVYVFLFSILNKKRILPEVNKRSLILFNMIFLYYFIPYYMPTLAAWDDLTFSSRAMLVLLTLPSIAVLINGLIPLPQFRYGRVFFYVWYLVMTAGLMIFMIYPQAIDILSDTLITQKWVTMISLGMVALCVCANIINILILLPITTRGQSSAQRMEQVRYQIKLLNSKYLDDDVDRFGTVLLIALVSLVFIANHLLIHANEIILVNIIFLIEGSLRSIRISKN